MSVLKFLKSRIFLIQLIIATLLICILVFVLVQWLGVTTNRGEEIEVPDLSKLSLTEAEIKLRDLNLNYQIDDTLGFDKNYPPNSIVEQDPSPHSKVKSGRKIYLKLNAKSYEMVQVPHYKDYTYRQVLPTLKALGLEEGNKTYRSYFAEDVVIELRHKGKILKPGDQVSKTSKIDFVLGDGKTVFLQDADTLSSFSNE